MESVKAIGSTFEIGSPEAFITTADNFMKQYAAALEDPNNLTAAARGSFGGSGAVDAANIRNLLSSEHLNLNIFNKETSDRLYGTFRDEVAKINQVMQHQMVGLPRTRIPNRK